MKIIFCSNCNQQKVHMAKGLCKPCYHAKWQKENWEERKNYHRAWRLKNRERILDYWRKYRANTGWQREYHKKYYLKNKEKWEKYNLNRNKKEQNEKKNEWRRKFRQTPKGRLYTRMEKMKRRNNIDSLEVERVINDNLIKYGIYTCENCRELIFYDYNIDHIIPVSKDGNNDYGNLQILCKKCNKEKFTKIIDYRVTAYLEAH